MQQQQQRKRDRLKAKLSSKLPEWKDGKVVNFEVPMFIGCVAASLLFVSCESKAVDALPDEVPKYHNMETVLLTTQQNLAVNAYHEARSESDFANMMIMAVIENRVNGHKRYGSSVEEVVYKKHAFEWTQDGKSDYIHNDKQYKRLYKLAEMFLLNKETFVTLSQGADHYVKVGHKTNWDYSKLIYITTVDNHIFYKHK